MHDRIVTELGRLAKLGTPAAVAADLYDRGVRGVRDTAAGCPLARHLKTVSGHPAAVDANRVIAYGAPETGGFQLIDVPAVVGAFVRLFDARRYPELEGRP